AEGGPGWLDAKIVEALDTNLTMVSRVRETFVTKGQRDAQHSQCHQNPQRQGCGRQQKASLP
ncbi:MAG: hypothetical protein R6W95_05130, partial [Desulfosarcina sp.]